MSAATATIRMYRLNELGDCFLLTFVSGEHTSRVLIDCGSFRNGEPSTKRLEAVVDSIASETDHALDVIVGTHQHNDHLSGFVHCEDAFKAMTISQVWLSWLDDPSDPQAREIGKDYNNLMARLTAARRSLRQQARRDRRSGSQLAKTVAALDDAFGFLGAKDDATPPVVPANAVKILKKLGTAKPQFLTPGRSLDLPGLPTNAVRVHVLGPPRNKADLLRKDPRKGESYDHALAAASLMATRFLDAAARSQGAATSRTEEHYPFSDQCKRPDPGKGSEALAAISGRYNRRTDSWRTIDDAWMQTGEQLALFMDTFTNNSSLVLAFELVESGKVLLFVADAQSGNWASWQDVDWTDENVTTDGLLSRTVFYKVGHHASHNATQVAAFEKMSHPDLVALIPVHKQDPNITKKNGWKMPARNLFRRIVERTENRVLQMDDDNPPECDPDVNPAKAAWKRVSIKPVIDPLFVELEIKG